MIGLFLLCHDSFSRYEFHQLGLSCLVSLNTVIASKGSREMWWPNESARRVSDLSPLVSATSKGDKLTELMSSLFLNMAHIMGVIQAKVVKDRKPALSTGWDLDMQTPLNIRSVMGKICRSHSQ